MKFVFDAGKFYLEFSDGIREEVSEQLWSRLMKRERKDLAAA